MHCDRARDALLERLDRPLDEAAALELETHLQGCGECRAVAADLVALEAQARVWHELTPPRWNPVLDPGTRPTGGPAPAGWRAPFAAWFPTLASAAALVCRGVQSRGPVAAVLETRCEVSAGEACGCRV